MRETMLLLLTGLTLFTAVSAVSASKVIEPIAGGEINWKTGMITVTGEGAPPMKTINIAQARAMAKRAAIADAYRKLAEVVNGVRVDAQTVVENYTSNNDEVRIKVQALIKGVAIGDLKYLKDGSVKIQVSLPLYGRESLGEIIYPAEVAEGSQIPNQGEESGNDSLPAATEGTTGTTGLIVDVSDTEFMPAMCPKVVSDKGEIVYLGPEDFDVNQVIEEGVSGFAETVAEAKADVERVGTNPLLIKAQGVKGAYKADAIISSDDANKVLSDKALKEHLKKCRVVFVVS